MRKRARNIESRRAAERFSATSLMLALILLPLASFTIASVATGKTQDPSKTSPAEEVPLIAEDQLDRLIAGRQGELERRRNALQASIDELGSNHPAVAAMQAERDELNDQITLWSSPIDELLSVEDRDLRVLVLQLAIRVDQLETENRDQQYRIQKAQTSQNVFHSSGPSSRGNGGGPSGGGPPGRGSRPPGPPPRR